MSGWKLGADCTVEQYPAIFIWRCGGCLVVGLQPIIEPDNLVGVERALVRQHKEALGKRCRVNTVPEYLRVR